MEEENPTDLSNVTVRLEGKENVEAICNMLRGLLLASRVIELKGVTNSRLLRGLTFSFGDPAIAQQFVTDVGGLFSKKVRDRLEIALHD